MSNEKSFNLPFIIIALVLGVGGYFGIKKVIDWNAANEVKKEIDQYVQTSGEQNAKDNAELKEQGFRDDKMSKEQMDESKEKLGAMAPAAVGAAKPTAKPGDKPADKPAEEKPADKPAEEKPADKPAEDKPADKPAEGSGGGQ